VAVELGSSTRVYFKLGGDPSGFPQTRRVSPQLEMHPFDAARYVFISLSAR